MIIGLSGRTGCGKTTVSNHFEKAGFCVFNADKIYRKILQENINCIEDIGREFSGVLDDSLKNVDRAKLAKIVFSNSEKLNILNKITHHYVIDYIECEIEKLSQAGKTLFLIDAPQLFESGIDKKCDLVISVIATVDSQKQRIIDRDSLDEKAAQLRIDAQKEEKFYIENSNITIENNGSLKDLEQKIKLIIQEVLDEKDSDETS